METIWTEKYRPKSLDDLIGNQEVIRQFKRQVAGSLQHLLICGPAGIGKTSAMHCLAREILGDSYGQACLELNAADERGIDVVRDKIKTFAKTQITRPNAMSDGPAGVTKIVILDEVEAMTEAAQQALRRTMELFPDTRFCLACNQSEKVIDPIQSRCLRINMMPLRNSEMEQALIAICNKEGVSFTAEALAEIVNAAQGDMRKAVGSLQAAATAFGKIEIPLVYHACDIPPTKALIAALNHCRKGSWHDAHDCIFKLVEAGFSPNDILKAMRNVVQNSDLPDVTKTACTKEFAYALLATDRAIDNVLLDATLAKLCIRCLTVR